MKDRSAKSVWLIVGLLLLGVAALLIALRLLEKQTPERDSGTKERKSSETRRFQPTNLDGSTDGQIGENSANQKSAKPPVVAISGVGPLPYKRVIREMNLNDILFKCGLLTEGDIEMRMRSGDKTVANVYLNEKGEIVHMGYGKGLYRTYSRDREAMASFDRNDMPGGGGLRIVEYGIPGLTLENIPLLKQFLGLSSIKASIYSDNPYLEIEVTPVIVEVTKNFQGDPKYIGRRFPMLLKKKASGPIPTSEHREDFLEFHPRQMVRREWQLQTLLPDPEDADGGHPRIGGGGPFDEPLLDVWLEKYPEKNSSSREGE